MGIGGIVGSVDPNTKLWIDSCKVDDNTVQGAIAVGGILGGAERTFDNTNHQLQ